MRDHVTEELISAYADGELTGDELKLAESLLAESAEHRQLLAEFQALRASIWSLPISKLPADFHTRVVTQIDKLAVSPSKAPVHRTGRRSTVRPWRTLVFAVASLAAVFAVTVMLRLPTPPIEVPGAPGVGTTPVAMPVYLKQEPSKVFVYDVTVTRAGQKRDAIARLLRNHGIGIDPALRLDSETEKDLVAIRESENLEGDAIRYEEVSTRPKGAVKDRVEMIYVAGTAGTLGALGEEIRQLRTTGEDVSHVQFGLVFEPNKLGVMHRLHRSAREHFAQSTDIVPSEAGQAFQVVFKFRLTSVSVPGAATFPVPTFGSEAVSPGRLLDPATSDVNAAESKTDLAPAQVARQLNLSSENRNTEFSDDEPRGPDNPADGEMDAAHILLILRYVGADADDAKANADDTE